MLEITYLFMTCPPEAVFAGPPYENLPNVIGKPLWRLLMSCSLSAHGALGHEEVTEEGTG
jgi:hypothetical protein